MKDDAQRWGDPTIQIFRLDESSEFMYASVEGIETIVPHDRTRVTLDKENIFLEDESYLDAFFMVQVNTCFNYKYI